MDFGAILALSVSFFLILDPFASVPMFLRVTDSLDNKTVATYANRAIAVATILLLAFIICGDSILGLFGVTIDTFRVAGGIIFLMMAIEMVFSLQLSKAQNTDGAAWAVIASPVLTGPGIITAAVIGVTQYGILPVFIASIIALFVTWIVLRLSRKVMKVVGEQALDISTKVIGLFIAAMGVQSIFAGTLNWIQANTATVIGLML